MTKPDIIISWPRNCDYPLWRQFIRKNRARFNEVLVVFTETNHGDNYRDFVREAMMPDYVLFVENRDLDYGSEDWRNVAINSALLHSYNSEWVWFTEQDFIITEPDIFWKEVEENMNKFDALAVYVADRMHPCCTFVKRSLLDRTHKDFSAKPPEYDHFGRLQKDFGALQSPVYSLKNGYIHLNGLTHNMSLVERHEAPNYDIQAYAQYMELCLMADIEMDRRFIELANASIRAVK